MEDAATQCFMVMVVYSGLTADTPIFRERAKSPFFLRRSVWQLLFFLFHSLPSKSWTCLRGQKRCVLFLLQFELITQLWWWTVTSCDDKHCSRAGEILFFPPLPINILFLLFATGTVFPLLLFFFNWWDMRGCVGGLHVHLRTPPSPDPPLPATHPFPSPLLLDGHAHLQYGGKRRTWQACRCGDVNPPETLTHTHTDTLTTTSHTAFIGRYRDSISCQIEMGIKEEAGNYLSALSKRFVNDRRCEERTGLPGTDDTVIRICQSDWKRKHTVQGVCFHTVW